MNWPYHYTPYIWPMLASATFAAVLGFYCWRRRSVPGAFPLAIMMLFGATWAVSAALELAAVDVETKIFWFKFVFAVCTMPIVIARLCFVMEYAGLGRWLTRRTLALLAVPILLQLILVLTNGSHHLMWRGFTVEEAVTPVLGIAAWFLMGFSYLVLVVVVGICTWLFFRSPPHRGPVALILCSMLTTNTMFLLDTANINPFAPLDLTILSTSFGFSFYAVALFGFRMFDPIPVARRTVIQQMQEGMLVLDTGGKIVDLNPAAERLLGLPAARVRGHAAVEILPACPELSARLDDPGLAPLEINFGAGNAARYYALYPSLLKERHGFPLGTLILLHDVTEQKRAQAQLMEQQRALAALQERERVARELHDGLGQVLGYVKMQAQAARERLAQDQKQVADDDLAQLVAVAQDAHADVREYILGARSGTSAEPGLLPALRQYLQRFGETYRIRTELITPSELSDGAFEPTVEVQLLRIIQEALTNARKHAHAQSVQVRFCLEASRAQVIVQDDGAGFDPSLLATAEGQKFGLGFMRERAEEVGGRVEVQSSPGQGTRVVVEVPVVNSEQ